MQQIGKFLLHNRSGVPVTLHLMSYDARGQRLYHQCSESLAWQEEVELLPATYGLLDGMAVALSVCVDQGRIYASEYTFSYCPASSLTAHYALTGQPGKAALGLEGIR